MIDERNPRRPNQVEYAFGGTTPASVALAMAISELEDEDPSTLGFTVYEYVDPDALDALVGDGYGSGALEIDLVVENYDVRIDDGGRILVSRRAN